MPREHQQFQSEALASGDYDTDTQTLDITFTNGRTYTFEMVPEHVWEGLVGASSAGTYFFTNIKGRY